MLRLKYQALYSSNCVNKGGLLSRTHKRWGLALEGERQRQAELTAVAASTTSRRMSTGASEKLFDKVLIANRGEISVRVIRTCQRLGIKTVAVYSEPDRKSMAVRMADEAVCVGTARSADSYLNIPRIMEAVKSTGAQAVHPGYGFLSENFHFSQALLEAGVKFIGPDYHAISAMGDKIESKKLAIAAGVNTIPGFLSVLHDEEEAIKVSREIGYPVMIKASGGGGGKGMRVAYNDEEAKIGFRLSKQEAKNSFGDDRMFIEKFIEDPRHIEIQLLADDHGNVVPFPERECSIQRRNQKVIEEAPSVLLDDATRLAMGEQVKMLAKAVGYKSAGTVEFLCDKDKNFYFLEMNTRLQVEHPVTEMISGVDLVEQMLRIAAGHKLPDHLLKGPIPIQGWAMESRVYAEDPFRGFLPSIGRLITYEEPLRLPGVRVDSGVSEGSDISMFYDPMISKLITHGENRKECLERMKNALDHYVIVGPGHNLSFLQDVYRHPRFESGKITTKFIPEEYPDGFQGVQLTSIEKWELVCAAFTMHLQKSDLRKSISGQLKSSFVNLKTKTLEGDMSFIKLESNEDLVPCFDLASVNTSTEDAAKYLCKHHLEELAQFYVGLNGPFGGTEKIYVARLSYPSGLGLSSESNLLVCRDVEGEKEVSLISDVKWRNDGPLFSARFDEERQLTVKNLGATPEGFRLIHHGAIHDVVLRTPKEEELSQHMLPKPEIDTSKFLQCPMPGVLISVAVKEGDHVEVGQELAVIEAMKMQNVLRAEKKGVIASIRYKEGTSLRSDDIIMEFQQPVN